MDIIETLQGAINMSMEKKLVDPALTQESLRALRDELNAIYLGKSGDVPNIIMKINSCLFSRYPTGIVAERSDPITDAERLNWLEKRAKKSVTGVTIIHNDALVEDGVLRGFRFMQRRYLGDTKPDVRKCIDDEMRSEADFRVG